MGVRIPLCKGLYLAWDSRSQNCFYPWPCCVALGKSTSSLGSLWWLHSFALLNSLAKQHWMSPYFQAPNPPISRGPWAPFPPTVLSHLCQVTSSPTPCH